MAKVINKSRKKCVIKEPILYGDTIYLEGLSKKHLSKKYVCWFNDRLVCKETRHGLYRYTMRMMDDYVKSVDRSDCVAVFAIMTRKENIHIGNISLTITWETGSGEISIILGEKSYWGKGIATQAYGLVIDYGFKILDLHKLISGMTLRNKAMIRVARKVGMKRECVLIEDAILGNGEYVDIVQYSIFNPKHKK